MAYKSTAIIYKEGKWFIARSAELGVTTQGKTIEAARRNLKEAVELYLEDMPRMRKHLKNNLAFVTSIDVSRG